MKFQKKHARHLLIIIFILLILYFICPIMISSSGIIMRQKVDSFNDQYSLNVRYNENKFSHSYLIDFHILKKIEIRDTGTKQPEIQRILPFLYSIEQLNDVFSIYEVSSGNNKYYFVYLCP